MPEPPPLPSRRMPLPPRLDTQECVPHLPSGPTRPVTIAPTPGGDSTGGLIPYKNPSALVAYYLGLLSGIPILGLPLGIAAVVLGFRGLAARQLKPEIKGSVHAGIGIGCGGVFAVLWLVVIGMIVLAVLIK